MGTNSVVIIPVADESHLRWIIDVRTIEYKRKPKNEYTLFDKEDDIFDNTNISHVILISYLNGSLHYLTSACTCEGTTPIPATQEDLELLSHPHIEQIGQASPNYMLIDVDTQNFLKPSLDVNEERLIAFLREQYATNVCSIYTTDKLLSEGVIKENGKGEIPDISFDFINDLRNTFQEEKRETSLPKGDPYKKNKVRAAKELLRITFPDGNILCDKNSVTTYIQAIEKIGIEDVAALGLEYCKTPLLSREYSKNKNYKAAQHEVKNGWLLFTQGSTTTKQIMLMNISRLLNLGLKIEKGSDIKPLTYIRGASKKVERTSLLVELEDGTFVAGENPKDTYIKTIRHIGLDKVRRVNADIAGVPLVTLHPVSNAIQSDEHNGMYITIPNGTKKMYKYLMLIASFTHTRLKATII